MSWSTAWESVIVGIFEGLGIVSVVWFFHQVRKFLYYHGKWKFYSLFDDRDTDLGRAQGPTSNGRQLYWTIAEGIGTGKEPSWHYSPMVYEKPSWWYWIRRSFYYSYKHQQWKPVEYLSPMQMMKPE